MSPHQRDRSSQIPAHVAIIMDGNGRWAEQRRLPRFAGHRAGTENIRRIITECVEQGVRYLTLYAFSTENWSRPAHEVDGLLSLLGEFLDRELGRLHQQGVRIRHLGRLDRLAPALQRKIAAAIDLTRGNSRLTLAVAFNYGGRADIVDAVRALLAEGVDPMAIDEQRIAAHLSTNGMPDPDLIIRTSGEWRISNFLLWQAAYSEYWFTAALWPDFAPEHLRDAIREYSLRSRRFGGYPRDDISARPLSTRGAS
jgi:undecaprenyl diphosphate synthase